MTTFSKLQKTVEEFEAAKQKYWADLDTALSHLVHDALLYFRYPENNTVIEDGYSKYIDIGVYENEQFLFKPPTLLPTDGLKVQFALKIMLGTSVESSKYAKIFDLNFFRRNGVYFIESQSGPFDIIALGSGDPSSIQFDPFFIALGSKLESIFSPEQFE